MQQGESVMGSEYLGEVVYLLWKVNRSYDSRELVGVFSSQEKARGHVVLHPSEKSITRWVDHVEETTRNIPYELQEARIDWWATNKRAPA